MEKRLDTVVNLIMFLSAKSHGLDLSLVHHLALVASIYSS